MRHHCHIAMSFFIDFLIHNLLFQIIMQDKWMNIGYESDELKPHIEPKPDLDDQRRLGNFIPMLAIYFDVSF